MNADIFILFAVIYFMSIIRNVHSDKEFCKPIRKYVSEEDDDGPVHVFEEYIYIPIRFFTEVTLMGFESEDPEMLPYRVDDFTLEDYTFDDEEDEEEEAEEEGDIIIDEEQEKILSCENTNRNVRPIDYYKWPNGIVYYSYLPNATRFQQRIQPLMDKLSQTSCVSFKEADDKSPTKVQIFRSDTHHCGASVGKLNKSTEYMEVTVSCLQKTTKAYRLPLHLLGATNQIQRPNTKLGGEQGAQTHQKNIKRSALPQFACKDESTFWNTSYSFDSALQFDFDAYSKNRRLTITPTDPLVEGDMYNTEKPSFTDLVAVNRMYSCEEKCADSSFACKNDGFKTGNAEGKCICICPKGFKGDQCEDASPLPACNKKFTNREGNIVSPSEFYKDKKCVYWLQAPKSKHIALQFDKFELAPRSKNGLCETEYLNVRSVGIHSDVPGRRFCGAELHKHWFQSRFEDIILIYKTGFEKSDGFHGSYFVIH